MENNHAEADGDLLFHQMIRPSTGCASYVVGSKTTRRCMLVDPLVDVERYEPLLKEERLDVVALIDTHTHADHISGLRAFSVLYPRAAVLMHESCPASFKFRRIRDGERLDETIKPTIFPFSDVSIKALYTPGHARDHICVLIESEREEKKVLISGDCLFVHDVGRTDLGRGDNAQMYESLFEKLLALDTDTEVYPAHVGTKHYITSGGVKTTIAEEGKSNPALTVKSKEEFFKYMTEDWPPKPAHCEKFVEVNLGRMELLDAQEQVRREELKNMGPTASRQS